MSIASSTIEKTVTPATDRKKKLRQIILSCTIGNALEWYDFALYGYFATIIGDLFFPSTSQFASLMATFGVFAAGFLMRPIGGLIFGYIGDKIDRKKALLWSVYLMAIPTAALVLSHLRTNWLDGTCSFDPHSSLTRDLNGRWFHRIHGHRC